MLCATVFVMIRLVFRLYCRPSFHFFVMVMEFGSYGYRVGELGITVGLRIGQSVSLLYLYE